MAVRRLANGLIASFILRALGFDAALYRADCEQGRLCWGPSDHKRRHKIRPMMHLLLLHVRQTSGD
eukprot:5614-Eustigmatos_ZCMA.PRE.1